jgi:hypothetical protein
MLIGLGVGEYFSNKANAGCLYIQGNAQVNNASVIVNHVDGATEGYDMKNNYDVVYLLPQQPYIDFYSEINDINDPNHLDVTKLKRDSRPSESMSTIYTKIGGVGLPDQTDFKLSPSISLAWGQNNFSWKNIIGELYNNGDVNDSNNLLGVYDMKHMDKIDAKIPLVIDNGLSYQLLIKFFNHADFNRDRLIDKEDFKIFAQNWGRTGIVKGSDPNNLGDYADISDIYDKNGNLVSYGDGVVDNNDLAIFKTYFKFPGDLNLDGIVNNTDFAYLADDWNAGDANFYDLSAFVGDYLKDINVPSTW